MSIPFIFQPRGDEREIVDGGLSSNFPVWLFTEAGHKHWPVDSIDDKRLKVGFLLNEKTAPPANEWRPARFPVSGNPPRVELGVALKPLLRAKLTELGHSAEIVDADLARWFGPSPDIELIHQMLGVLNGVMNTEESTRSIITRALMQGMPYIEIAVPLLGFHALDFGVNEDEAKVMEMWHRAWREAAKQLALAKAKDSLPPLVSFNASAVSPFL